MDAMNNKEVETLVPLKVMAVIVYKASLQFGLWGETEVITSEIGGMEVPTSEEQGCL
jgi:hypothetical protein